MGITALSDGVITLRAPTRGDVDAHWRGALESANEVGRWLPWCHPAYQRGESLAWVESCRASWNSGDSYEFFFFDVATAEFLGAGGVNQIDIVNRRANLGYWVRTACTGRGVATAATRLIAQFAFEQLALLRVEIVAAVGNVASQRVAEKAGATREGILRNRLRLRGEEHDAVVFSLIPSDCA